MTLNEKKLTEMVGAVKIECQNTFHPNVMAILETHLRTALTKFALEMTDEEIMNKAMDEDFNDVSGFINRCKIHS